MIFDAVHFVNNVVADFGLEFPNEVTENPHLENGHESGFFKNVAVVSDSRKGPVDLEQRMIRAEFFGIVRDSHCASNPGAKVRARQVLVTSGASA
ncbi:MAG TPA: hypothetical protein VG649_02280 [Candidatus Angelobacter sp.]|nr:hypothetical protein [Candidatus Angelobacter sp.]